MRRALTTMLVLTAVAGLAAGGATAQPAADHFQSELGDRYRLLSIEQPQRDLTTGSALINVLFDTRTGRSWVLRYDVDPVSRRDGYVWVEVPMVGPAK
ncbi:MAG: hypothetical protein IRY94_00980 [Rhodospirillaceae bacterium]|nr:hypothetical protein [Rhodospirillaceae bacterium]